MEVELYIGYLCGCEGLVPVLLSPCDNGLLRRDYGTIVIDWMWEHNMYRRYVTCIISVIEFQQMPVEGSSQSIRFFFSNFALLQGEKGHT